MDHDEQLINIGCECYVSIDSPIAAARESLHGKRRPSIPKNKQMNLFFLNGKEEDIIIYRYHFDMYPTFSIWCY